MSLSISPKKVAIMQPTFLPWLGYFALIDSVDEFILLDNVQFDKRSWQQRNKILSNNVPMWLTVPVLSKGKMHQNINEVQIRRELDSPPFSKHIKSLELNYKKSPFFADYFDDIKAILLSAPDNLSLLNSKLLELLCKQLGISFNFTCSSSLAIEGVKDELLFNICTFIGATHYVSPPGSMDYLQKSPFFASSPFLSYGRFR